MRREFDAAAAEELRRRVGQSHITNGQPSIAKTEEKKNASRKSVQFSEQVQV